MPGTTNAVELQVLETKSDTPENGEDEETEKKLPNPPPTPVHRKKLVRKDVPKKRKSASPSISSLYSLTSIKPCVDSPLNGEQQNVSYYTDPKTGGVVELNVNHPATTCTEKSPSDNFEEMDPKMRRYSYARSSIGDQENSAFKVSLLTVLGRLGMFRRPRPSRSTSRLSSVDDEAGEADTPRFMENLEDMAANYIFGGMCNYFDSDRLFIFYRTT
jgi:hypothetical protein